MLPAEHRALIGNRPSFGKVGRRLEFFGDRRRADRENLLGNQQFGMHIWPLTIAQSHRDINVRVIEIDEFLRGVDAQDHLRIPDKVSGQPLQQPF